MPNDYKPEGVPTERAAVQLKKGQVIGVVIASLAPGGEGVTREHGIPIFVNRTAVGDKVEVKLFDVRKDFARGEVVRLIEPSVTRHEPPCKLFKVCGGCQWQHITYEAQLEAKTDIVRQAVKHIGRLNPDLVLPTIGATSPLYYRNKAQFPVGMVRSTGRILAGYYEQNSHELVNIKHCPVQPEPLDRALTVIKEELQQKGVSVYDETTHTGVVRHIAERYSFDSGQVLLTLVINEQQLQPALERKLKAVASSLMSQVPLVSGVCVNFNPARGNRIMGEVTRCLAGEAHIVEVLRSHLADAPSQLRDGIKFRLSATSFFQVNTMQAEVLLDQVLLAVVRGAQDGQGEPLKPVPLLVDAYAGVGTMALWLASMAGKILAIEEASSSVKDGQANLELNGLDNVEFIKSKVEIEVPRLLKQGLTAGVVVVDPPRKGIEPMGLDAIVELGADRIVYVSCNPATLARDLRLLTEKGYTAKQIQPVDMFPQTFHIETVTVLERS